jgi:hypothetical protein
MIVNLTELAPIFWFQFKSSAKKPGFAQKVPYSERVQSRRNGYVRGLIRFLSNGSGQMPLETMPIPGRIGSVSTGRIIPRRQFPGRTLGDAAIFTTSSSHTHFIQIAGLCFDRFESREELHSELEVKQPADLAEGSDCERQVVARAR